MMKASLQNKLDQLLERYEEISVLLSQQEIINDQKQFQALSKEYAKLQPVVEIYQRHQTIVEQIEQAQILIDQETDAEMRQMAKEELATLQQDYAQVAKELEAQLLPRDPNDDANVFLEIRAGAGGDEAAIFAGDLYRMYARYAEMQGWQMALVNASEGEHGGYKEIVTKITGDHVYAHLKFESGAHRVQRVPATESQGRIHTSACTVAVLPEVDEVEEIEINPGDLRIDTFRASGAGGQHVNKTDSAIRITHLSTGLVVECQSERSQHKNKAAALAMLKSRLHQQAEDKQAAEAAETRRNLVGTGDRSDRIRTYNYPQGRVTDHRINLTLYKLDEIMQGHLSDVIQPLTQEHQADLLAQMEA